jgi:hypothetical protein
VYRTGFFDRGQRCELYARLLLVLAQHKLYKSTARKSAWATVIR